MRNPHDPAHAVSRRGLIGAGLGGAVAAPALFAGGAVAGEANATPDDPSTETYPFEGPHQQGILTPTQGHAAYLALDVTAANRAELTETLKTITDQARFLTVGGTPPSAGMLQTDVDNGILGPQVPPDALTVTLGVGASLFDGRFGLASRKPARLRRMDEFPDDDLDRTICDGDLLLQVCANSPDTVIHAVRQITRVTRGALAVRWRQDGFNSVPRPSGTPRNLLGFKDGTNNPDVTDASLMDQLVWTHAGGGEPAWVEGGTYQVVRIIRMLVEFWDRVSIREQNGIFGRDKATGAPLTGTTEFDKPDYASDPTSEVLLPDSHIRRASNSGQALNERLYRRGFNYDNGVDTNGNLDMGLVFTAFNQDLDRQFVAIQKRLAGESLVDYISPRGGGYFFALPGVQGGEDWLGRGMLA